MNQRKSLADTLQTVDLPPEALAVIKEGSVRSIEARRMPLVSEPIPEASNVQAPQISRVRPPKVVDIPEDAVKRGLVPLSVRIQADLSDFLLRVAFERKLQRKEPYSQQDIVTEAVTQWLRKHGYAFEER